MMNGTKKSDSSIVPAKPANKAERSTAELVEGDDGTKRNAELQSMVRTQSREAVTQAQARIRGAVTRNEKEKLTALLHHVSIDVLRWAFFNIKKQAAPGVDGLTWVDYAADLCQIASKSDPLSLPRMTLHRCGVTEPRSAARSPHSGAEPVLAGGGW